MGTEAEQKNVYDVILASELKLGMIVVGLDGTPPRFCATRSTSNITQKFLEKYQFGHITVTREGKDRLVSYENIRPTDKIIKLGRMKNHFRIKSPEHIELLKSMEIDNIFVQYMNEEELDNLKILNPNLSIEDFYSLDPTSVIRSPAKSRVNKHVTAVLTEFHQLQDDIPASEKIQEDGAELLGNFFGYGNRQPIKTKNIENLASKMCYNMPRNNQASSVLMILKDHDDYTFRHCVDVSNQLLYVLKYMGSYDEQALQEITVGALFHDIGKSKIPLKVLNKPGRLNEEEWEMMKLHPVYSAEIMRGLNMKGLQIEMGFSHHSRKDDTGYPHSVDYQNTAEIVRLLMIVDVYQALVTNRPYRDPDTPFLALKKIRSWAPKQFDSWLVDVFIKAFGIYPVGSFLHLSNNQYGFVISNDQYSLRPTLMICFDKDGKRIGKPDIMDLTNKEFKDVNIEAAVDHRTFFKGNDALQFFMKLDM
ncbi:MAG: HD domain-containing protein [SAR324 cluster bacterium]|nr:HD domain-containing protein [SAR324 cluster bacterium]